MKLPSEHFHCRCVAYADEVESTGYRGPKL